MSNWNFEGKRPSTMAGWKGFVDGLSRHKRSELYPGMHKDLIPATEMIDAGWTGQNDGSIETYKSEPENENIDYTGIAQDASSALSAGAGDFRTLANALQNGWPVDEAEIMRLRQLGVKGSDALNTLANACDKATRALNRPLRFVRTEACGGKNPTACAQPGGYEIRVTHEFDGLPRERQVSVLGHEGVHLSGTSSEIGVTGAETVESAVFGAHSKPYTQPPYKPVRAL